MDVVGKGCGLNAAQENARYRELKKLMDKCILYKCCGHDRNALRCCRLRQRVYYSQRLYRGCCRLSPDVVPAGNFNYQYAG